MSYKESLEAAGAKVLEFQEFGSYQGDWWAQVEVGGVRGWVKGSYGSCSGCDAFQSEFGWDDEEKPDYAERLAAFGREYLGEILSQEEAEKKAGENIEWDMDAQEMIDFVKNHSVA
jgi:hypothetical protein